MVTTFLAFVAVSRYGFAQNTPPSPLNAPVAGQAGPTTVAGNMSVPQPMVRTEQLLRTPKIDGKIDVDEWDVFYDNRLRGGMTPYNAPTAPPGGPPNGTAGASPAGTPVGGGNPAGTGSPSGTGTPTTPPQTAPAQPGTPAPTTPLPGTPAQGSPTQPVTPAPGPSPLQGTPIRRTPNPDPKAKPPQTVPPVTPPVTQPAPVPVTGVQTTSPGTAPVPTSQVPPPAPIGTFGILTTYLNWEPGKIYLAATLGAGQDLIVSIDGKADGFLVGKDNLEFRITPGAVNTVKARVLDATNPAGPVWMDAPGYVTASQVASTTVNGVTTVEICLVDPGYGIVPAKLGDTFAVRFDAVGTGSAPTEPFLPRVTTPVKLVDVRTDGLPANFKLTVPPKGRGAFPNDSTTMHWQFSAAPGTGIKRVDITPEGWLNDYLSSFSVPSPDFDPKGNSTVDFQTKVVKGAPVGYGVLKAVVNGDGWGPAFAEVSFRVQPPLDLDIPAKTVKYAETSQKVKSVVQIRSNSDRRIEGHLQILPPAGWTVNSGSDRNFYIQDRRGAVLAGFELQVPGGVRGSFPITLRVAAIGTIIDQTYWITIL